MITLSKRYIEESFINKFLVQILPNFSRETIIFICDELKFHVTNTL